MARPATKAQAPLVTASWHHKSKHLGAAELLPAPPDCLFCGSTDRSPVSRLQASPAVDLLVCHGCGAASASRMPTYAALDAYYGSYYGGGDGAENVTIDLPARLGARIHSYLGSLAGRPEPRILDFGGGDGTIGKVVADLLLAAGASKVHVCIADYHAREGAPVAGVEVECHQRLEEVSGRRFDVVIASAIVEHLPEPMPALRALLGALDSGGVFYARTPALLAFVRVFERLGLSFDLTFPGHLHDLGQPFWDHVLDLLPDGQSYALLASQPAIVETTLGRHLLRTLAAHTLKAPWRVLGKRWGFAGGWEVLVRRK